MEAKLACSVLPENCRGLLYTAPDCARAAVAQNMHNANTIVFIMISRLEGPGDSHSTQDRGKSGTKLGGRSLMLADACHR